MITNGNGAARCASRTIQVWLTVLASKLAQRMPTHKLLWSAACYVLSQHTAVSETTLVRYGNGDFIAPAYASDAWQYEQTDKSKALANIPFYMLRCHAPCGME